MFDFQQSTIDEFAFAKDLPASRGYDLTGLSLSKRVFDWTLASLLLLPLVFFAACLIALNPFLNAGPLFFRQQRMGYRCRPFMALKFRSMTIQRQSTRGAFDALETDRITVLGHLIRRMRIDELPQIINVFRGEMRMIGPRPDSYEHACVYVAEIPGYAARHQVVPGISGLAQTQIGYVDGLEGIQRKVAADTHYIAHATVMFDLWIVWRTICVVLGRRGI